MMSNARSVDDLTVGLIPLCGVAAIADLFPGLSQLTIGRLDTTIDTHELFAPKAKRMKKGEASAKSFAITVDEKMCEGFFRFHRLTALKIDEYFNGNIFLPWANLEALSLRPRLEVDVFSRSANRHSLHPQLKAAIEQATSLKSLALSFPVALSALENLTDLDMIIFEVAELHYLEQCSSPHLEVLRLKLNFRYGETRFPNLNRLTSLKSLNLSEHPSVPAECVSALSLTDLRLWSFEPNIMTSFTHMTSMKSLLWYCSGSEEQASLHDFRVISKFRDLQALSIYGPSNFVGMSLLLDHVKLKSLQMDQFSATKLFKVNEINELLNKLDPATLDVLSLDQGRFNARSYELISRFTKLTSLTMSFDYITGVCDEWFAKLSTLTMLDTLELRMSEYLDDDDDLKRATPPGDSISLEALLSMLEHWPNINNLSMWNVTRDIDANTIKEARPFAYVDIENKPEGRDQRRLLNED